MVKYQESAEMYLETVLLLKKKLVKVHSINIAEELKYSRASVSRGVGLLVKKGLLEISSTGEINFTPKGRQKAEDIYERHLVITELLKSIGAPKEMAEDNACRIEHIITEDLFKCIKNFVYKN